MTSVLNVVLAVLFYPGLIVAVVAALALGWARAAGRAVVGGGHITSPLQVVREMRDGFARETLLPNGLTDRIMTLAAGAALIAPLLALLLLPVPGNPLAAALGLSGDLIAEGALLLGLPLVRLFIGWATPSPFTRLAADRGARLLAGAAATMVLALTASAEQAGTLSLLTSPTKAALPTFALLTRILAAAAFVVVLPVLVRLATIHEGAAESDLVAGELTELTGRDLACIRIAEALQLVAASGLFIAAFVLPLVGTNSAGVGRNLLWLAGMVLTAVGVGVWEGIAPRSPVTDDRPPLSWWLGLPLLLALLALVAAAWAARGV